MTPGSLPPWPTGPVAHGPVMLREFSARDVPMAQELSTDPYVPSVATLPANAGVGLGGPPARPLG
jgi:ribosomal-protein-alanine N-acetyltransferase